MSALEQFLEWLLLAELSRLPHLKAVIPGYGSFLEDDMAGSCPLLVVRSY